MGYWGVLGVLGSNSGYWWILWGTAGIGSTKGYLGGTLQVLQVLWGNVVNYGVLQVLGIKKEYCGVLHGTAGYHRVLGGTGVYWGALVGTKGTGGFWGYSVVPDGALENYWVQGYWVVQGGTWGYWEELGGTVGSWGVKGGTVG